jgi:hypothetical protein
MLKSIVFLALVNFTVCDEGRALIWPKSTVMQMSWALVTPVKLNYGNCGVNMGFNVAYSLISNATLIYKFPYWVARSIGQQPTPVVEDKYDEAKSKIRRDLSAGEVIFFMTLGALKLRVFF